MSAQSVFIDHPLYFCEESVTKIHSIPRADLEEFQREAMILRFAENRESIEMVRKLADRLGVTAVDKFDDIVPMMFSRTAYKSYPAARTIWEDLDIWRYQEYIERPALSKEDAKPYMALRRWAAQFYDLPASENIVATA